MESKTLTGRQVQIQQSSSNNMEKSFSNEDDRWKTPSISSEAKVKGDIDYEP